MAERIQKAFRIKKENVQKLNEIKEKMEMHTFSEVKYQDIIDHAIERLHEEYKGGF